MAYEKQGTQTIGMWSSRGEELSRNVWAEIRDGKLTMIGDDFGSFVGDWFGDDEFEYSYSFDRETTAKLFSILAEDGNDPALELQKRFSGSDACEKLEDFCKANGLTYEYFGWHS